MTKNSFRPSWVMLRGLTENAAVRSANIWAIVVPIVAKLMQGVEEHVTIQLFGHAYQIHLVLPFSWKVLFLAAVAFLLGNVLFAIFCPPLIKETRSFRDFMDQKRSGYELATIFDRLSRRPNEPHEPFGQLRDWFNNRSFRMLYPEQSTNIARNANPQHDEHVIADAYARSVSELSHEKLFACCLCTICYLIGLGAFAWLLGQNIWFVAQHW